MNFRLNKMLQQIQQNTRINNGGFKKTTSFISIPVYSVDDNGDVDILAELESVNASALMLDSVVEEHIVDKETYLNRSSPVVMLKRLTEQEILSHTMGIVTRNHEKKLCNPCGNKTQLALSCNNFVEKNETYEFELQCPQCEKILTNRRAVEAHFGSVSCTDCGWKTSSILSMSRHVLQIHGGHQLYCSGNNICSGCDFRTQLPYFMVVHVLQDHLPQSELFMIKNGDSLESLLAFGYEVDLNNYLARQLNLTGNDLVAEHGEMMFEEASKSELLPSLNINIYKDTNCIESSDMGSLINSRHTLHRVVPRHYDDTLFKVPAGDLFQCAQCELVFSQLTHCLSHTMTHTEEMLTNMCPVETCDDTTVFKTLAELETHRRICHGKTYVHRLVPHESMNSSLLDVSKEDIFQCAACSELFSDFSQCMQHMHKSHISLQTIPHVNDDFVCPIESCNFTFQSLGCLQKHVCDSHSQQVISLDEKASSKQPVVFWASKPRVNVGKIGIAKDSRRRFHCPQPDCDQQFQTPGGLDSHLNKEHPGSTTFVGGTKLTCCPHCTARFTDKRVLRHHLTNVHNLHYSDDMLFICGIQECRARFMSSAGLTNHQNTVHGGGDQAGVLICHTCKLHFGTKHNYSRHLAKVHGDNGSRQKVNSVRQCPIPGCSARLLTVNSLNRHMQRVHPDADLTSTSSYGGGVCPVCGLFFVSQRSLNRHTVSEHSLSSALDQKVYRCPLLNCEFSFMTLSGLNNHMNRNHKNTDMPEAETCPVCFKHFANVTALKLHFSKKHETLSDGHNLYDCVIEDCDARFETSHELNVHRGTAHKVSLEPDIFNCEHCNQTFTCKRLLWDHIKHSHYDKLPYVCTDCNQRFFKQSNLFTHNCRDGISSQLDSPAKDPDFYKLSRDRKLDCPVEFCFSRFVDEHSLNMHLCKAHKDVVIPGARSCTQCERRFPSELSLWKHMVKMHSTRSLHREVIHCLVKGCSERFKWRRHLELHLRRHHPDVVIDGDISCQYCPLRFPNERSLRMHIIKAHNEQLPVPCVIADCKKRFFDEKWLALHLERSHDRTLTYQCNECLRRCHTVDKMRQHQHKCKGEMTSVVTFRCSKCRQRFRSERKFADHQELTCEQQGGKSDAASKITCKICSLKLASASVLHMHMRSVHMDNYEFKCRACNLGFVNSKSFVTHCETVHDWRPATVMVNDQRPRKSTFAQAALPNGKRSAAVAPHVVFKENNKFGMKKRATQVFKRSLSVNEISDDDIEEPMSDDERRNLNMNFVAHDNKWGGGYASTFGNYFVEAEGLQEEHDVGRRRQQQTRFEYQSEDFEQGAHEVVAHSEYQSLLTDEGMAPNSLRLENTAMETLNSDNLVYVDFDEVMNSEIVASVEEVGLTSSDLVDVDPSVASVDFVNDLGKVCRRRVDRKHTVQPSNVTSGSSGSVAAIIAAAALCSTLEHLD